MKTVCKFKFLSATSGALRYVQTEQDGQPVTSRPDDKLIGTLYLRKAQVEGQPETLTITVETA